MSFFGCGESSDSDSSSPGSDNEEPRVEKESLDEQKSAKKRLLPPPLEALSAAKVPKFVTSHLHNDINWDRLKKDAPEVEPVEYKHWENCLPPVSTTNNVKHTRPDIALTKQVPQTLVPPTKAQLEAAAGAAKEASAKQVDHAISWSKMYHDGKSEKRRPAMKFADPELNNFCYTDTQKDKVAFKRTANSEDSKGKDGWKKL